MNARDYISYQSFSLSERPPSHSQSFCDCSVVTSFAGVISSSLHATKERDIKPKSARVKSLDFILIKFKF